LDFQNIKAGCDISSSGLANNLNRHKRMLAPTAIAHISKAGLSNEFAQETAKTPLFLLLIFFYLAS
jgi:hypothetical protein